MHFMELIAKDNSPLTLQNVLYNKLLFSKFNAVSLGSDSNDFAFNSSDYQPVLWISVFYGAVHSTQFAV